MKKKIIVLLAASAISLVAVTAVCVKAKTTGNTFGLSSDSPENIVWQHYSEVKSTDSSIGCLEYWTNCTNHEVVFEKPTTGSIQEGSTSSDNILSYLSNHYDDERFVAKKGTVAIDTVNSTNWTSKVYDGQNLNKFETGVTGSSQPGGVYADFNNYQYTGWTSDKPGVDAVYTLANNDDIRRVNTITLTYYSYQPVAPVNVLMEALDLNGNKVKVLEKTVTDTAATTETFVFNSINFKSLSIKTKAYQKDANGRSHFLMKDVSLSFTNIEPVPTGTANISTKDSSLWTCTAKEATNKIHTGSGNWWEDTSGTGDYLAMRAYQWSDWSSDQPGLTATYSNNDLVTVNNLSFTYFINSSAFIAHNFKMEISIVGGGKTTIVDTLTLDVDTVTKGSDINYSKTFGDLVFESLILKVTTNEPKGTSGNSVIFLKNIVASYK